MSALLLLLLPPNDMVMVLRWKKASATAVVGSDVVANESKSCRRRLDHQRILFLCFCFLPAVTLYGI